MSTTIFSGGDIVTLDPDRPDAEALAIRDGQIAGLGDLDKLEAESPGADRVDLEGGCLIPSLIDHHVHLTAIGLAVMNREQDQRLFLDLAGAESTAAIIDRVAERASRVPKGDWILGMGWNQHDWGTHELPTHQELSRAVPDHPVFLVRIDAHSAWLNEMAMQIAGIDATTADVHGGRILHDASGEPTGVVLERAAEPVLAHIPVTAGHEVCEAFGAAARALAARGVTAVFDAGFMASPAIVSMQVDFEVYLELLTWADAEDPLPIDVSLMVPSPSPLVEKIVADPDAYRDLSANVGVTHVKLYADGAFGSRGAALTHPYADDPSTSGFMRMTDEEIELETRRAVEAGLGISTHAIGDDAVHRVLAAYCRVADDIGGLDPGLFRIEHFGYSSREDQQLAAERGFLLVAQPNFIDPDSEGTAMEDWRLGTDNADRAYPWKTLADMGANLAMSSDYYVAPGAPLLDYFTAFARTHHAGRPAEGWKPGERLSRPESLQTATTLHPGGGGPTIGGVLKPGAAADLTVLSANPLTAPESEILGIRVRRTYRRGMATFGD